MLGLGLDELGWMGRELVQSIFKILHVVELSAGIRIHLDWLVKTGGQGSEIRVNNDKRDLGLAGRRCIKRRPSLSCNLHQMHSVVHFGSAWLIIIGLNRFFSFVDSFAYFVCVCCGNFSH